MFVEVFSNPYETTCFVPGHNLTNESIQICISWTNNVQAAAAHVINSFIIHHKRAFTVL